MKEQDQVLADEAEYDRRNIAETDRFNRWKRSPECEQAVDAMFRELLGDSDLLLDAIGLDGATAWVERPTWGGGPTIEEWKLARDAAENEFRKFVAGRIAAGDAAGLGERLINQATQYLRQIAEREAIDSFFWEGER